MQASAKVVSAKILKEIYTKRQEWVHKGQFGKLLIVSGSERHTGSPVFCGMAACRAGCDLVYLAAPSRAADVAAAHPTIITEPLDGKELGTRHVNKILELAKEVRATALLIGPGLWRKPETLGAICDLLRRIDLPMVVDADAIRALESNHQVIRNKTAVLTLHADEFKACFGVEVNYNLKERIAAVENAARNLGCTILLKGAVDIITDGSRTALNEMHSNLMTKGGMGDTLSGICGALLARGIEPFKAACAAAFINGKAGLLAVKEKGEGALATDLIEKIPQVIK